MAFGSDTVPRWHRELALGADHDALGDLFSAAVWQRFAQPELRRTGRCETCAGVYKSEALTELSAARGGSINVAHNSSARKFICRLCPKLSEDLWVCKSPLCQKEISSLARFINWR